MEVIIDVIRKETRNRIGCFKEERGMSNIPGSRKTWPSHRDQPAKGHFLAKATNSCLYNNLLLYSWFSSFGCFRFLYLIGGCWLPAEPPTDIQILPDVPILAHSYTSVAMFVAMSCDVLWDA